MPPLPDARTIADTCLCLSVRRAARAVSRRYDEAFRDLGLTSGQFSVLVAIAEGRGQGMVSLAEALGMDRTTLTAALKPLQRDGLVAAHEDEADRRSRHHRLTRRGRRILEDATTAWVGVQRALARHAPGVDLERLRRDVGALT